MGIGFSASSVVFKMAESASVTLEMICFPRPYIPCRTSATKAHVMTSHLIYETVSGLRKGSVFVRVMKVIQWRQYFFLSALVLATTPSVVAYHPERQTRANIGREAGGIGP